MVANRKSRKRVLELHQRHNNLDMQIYAFTPADIVWKEQRIIGLSLSEGIYKQISFPFPHAVYNRCFNKNLITIQRLEKIIGQNKCFNSINYFNKWDVYNLLSHSNLKSFIPDSLPYNKVKITELLKKYKLVYIKPSYGSKGRSVHRVEVMDNGDTHISLHSLAPTYICRKNEDLKQKLDALLKQEKYMVQQGISISQVGTQYFDIRVLLQKGIVGEWMVSTIACRVAYENYFNTSMCERVNDVSEILPRLFSPEKTDEILQSLNELSVKAAKVVESQMGSFGELSVDFVVDEHKNLWIIELNGKPQKKIFEDMDGFKDKELIYSRPLEYAYYLALLNDH